MGSWDGAIHLDSHLDRIQWVTITVQDQCPRLDRGKIRDRKVHVIVAIFKGATLLPQSPNLIITSRMTGAHELPFFRGVILWRHLRHQLPYPGRIILRTAHQHHSLNTPWL